jgi:hypothetical protein
LRTAFSSSRLERVEDLQSRPLKIPLVTRRDDEIVSAGDGGNVAIFDQYAAQRAGGEIPGEKTRRGSTMKPPILTEQGVLEIVAPNRPTATHRCQVDCEYIDLQVGPYQAQAEAEEWMGRGMGDPPLPTCPPKSPATEKASEDRPTFLLLCWMAAL